MATKFPPQPGECAKVFLPGESPWAECVKVNEDGTWLGRIANKLFHEWNEDEQRQFLGEHFDNSKRLLPKLHAFTQDELVLFKIEHGDGYSIWVPSDASSNRPEA